MKACSILYLPPPNVGYPTAIQENLARFEPGLPLITYSEHPWPGAFPLKGSPEHFRNATFADGSPNKFGMANAAFFTGLRLAQQRGFSHVIALEADCRVGVRHWDIRIMEEFCNLGRAVVAAGTLATYNPCNWSPLATQRWQDLIRRNTKKNFPVVTYGWLGAGVKGGTCVFPNGALAVYDLNWLATVFDLNQTVRLAMQTTAWDMAIGVKIWERFQEDAYEFCGYLDSIFSGFGDLVHAEEERRQILLTGKVVGVHQIKSDWVP